MALTLAIGDDDMLPKLWARVDAFHIDALSTNEAKPHAKTLARFAADDTTVTAPTSLEGALRASGFECHRMDDNTLTAQFAPRWRVRRHEPPRAADVATRGAIVIGAGLAGCAMTSRLASRGWRVTLIDRYAAPARDASGNPAGVFHPIVWPDDSVAARLTHAGFSHALNHWQTLEQADHDLFRSHAGLLQIADTEEDAVALADAITRFNYPREYVSSVSRDEASQIAGVEVARGGCFFPRGGAISPAAVCEAQLAQARESLIRLMNTEASRIEYCRDRWYVFDQEDKEIASAPVLVLANAQDAQRLLLPAVARTSSDETHRGRVAFRCVTSDRIPMIGQLADESLARRDASKLLGAWPLDLPRTPGLYGAFAFGSRGLVWATLAAELIAAQIEGEPWPIERELAEAIDPARFLLRALRHGEITAS